MVSIGVRGAVVPLLLVLLFALPQVGAHGTGTGSIVAEDTVVLAPAGSSESAFDLLLTDLGEIEEGDVVSYSWSVNGGAGPTVDFAITTSPAMDPAETVYGVTAASESDEWTLPRTAAFLFLWSNPNEEEVTVAYELEVTAPAPPLDLVPFAVLAVAGGLFVLLLWRGARRGSSPPEDEEKQEDRQR